MSRSLSRIRALEGGLAALLIATPAVALDSDEAAARARQEVKSVGADIVRLSQLGGSREGTHSPEKRIAAGELSLRTRDYERAIDTFSQVVELHRQGKAGVNAHADSLYLLGESYLESGQLLSARRQYSELLDLAARAPYDSYAGRSLARLVDVALHTGRHDALDDIERQAARLTIRDATGSFDYASGKLSFARGDLTRASQILRSVDPASAYYHQAQYVLGAILLQQAQVTSGETAEARARLVTSGAVERLAPAIQQFQKVTQLQGDSARHREVIDLAWMAIGRLYYEVDGYLNAAEAYLNVERSSQHYYEMLFELAWVYVRVGDYQRAERALELLDVAAPDTLHVADGALLRADLMLRSGRFDRALQAYEKVRDRFEPARQRVVSFLEDTDDPAIYYDRLVEESMAISGSSRLPELVLDWVREEARGDRVFAVIEDVTQARDVLRRSRRLASKLNAVLAAPSRARAFPELKSGLESSLGLVNQLSMSRRWIALGLEDVDDSAFSGELGQVRAERRKLMEQLLTMPVTPADFSRREEQGTRQWNRVSQALQRVTLETDKLQAVINGLKRVLNDAEQHGVTRDPASRARFQAEVEANERDLEVYRTRIDSYREDVESGRVQIGFGDRRYVEDETSREAFRKAFDREVALLSSGTDSRESATYARSLAPVLTQVTTLEKQLSGIIGSLNARVEEGSRDLRRRVDEESEHIELFAQRLDALDQHARLLVGEVAMRNFIDVRDRLKGIVLRADVGIVQQAWELREEQRTRLRNLQRQRALEEQNLDDELREVFDDAGGGSP